MTTLEDEMIAKEIADNIKYGEPRGVTGKRWKTERRKKDFRGNVEEFREERQIDPPKCISDRILLYIRYGLSEIERMGCHYRVYGDGKDEFKRFTYVLKNQPHDPEKLKKCESICMALYNDRVRGEVKYSGKNPLTVSAALVYMAVLEADLLVKQEEFCAIFSTTIPAWRRMFKDMVKDFGGDTHIEYDPRTGVAYVKGGYYDRTYSPIPPPTTAIPPPQE